MPYCSIITCKNHSRSINLANSGVSYHRFPNDPDIKEKWIQATGRAETNWSPQKNSTICSVHFDESIKYNLGKYNRVPNDAIPSLNLPGQTTTVNEDSTEENLQASEDEDSCDSSVKTSKKTQSALDRARKLIRKQTLLVKKLREQNRRASKKILLQNRVLNDLMEIYNLKKEDIAVLKNEIMKSADFGSQ